MKKLIDKSYMEEINKKANMEVFKKDSMDIPMVKVNKNKSGNIESIDLCNCGGTENYKECKKEFCNGYRRPTRYEYCKLGEYNKPYCVIEGPSESTDIEINNLNINDNLDADNTDRCKLKTLVEDRINITVNKLVDDCFTNKCEKGNLDNIKNRYTIEDKFFKIGDGIKSYGYNKSKEEINKNLGKKTLRDYLLDI